MASAPLWLLYVLAVVFSIFALSALASLFSGSNTLIHLISLALFSVGDYCIIKAIKNEGKIKK